MAAEYNGETVLKVKIVTIGNKLQRKAPEKIKSSPRLSLLKFIITYIMQRSLIDSKKDGG